MDSFYDQQGSVVVFSITTYIADFSVSISFALIACILRKVTACDRNINDAL